MAAADGELGPVDSWERVADLSARPSTLATRTPHLRPPPAREASSFKGPRRRPLQTSQSLSPVALLPAGTATSTNACPCAAEPDSQRPCSKRDTPRCSTAALGRRARWTSARPQPLSSLSPRMRGPSLAAPETALHLIARVARRAPAEPVTRRAPRQPGCLAERRPVPRLTACGCAAWTLSGRPSASKLRWSCVLPAIPPSISRISPSRSHTIWRRCRACVRLPRQTRPDGGLVSTSESDWKQNPHTVAALFASSPAILLLERRTATRNDIWIAVPRLICPRPGWPTRRAPCIGWWPTLELPTSVRVRSDLQPLSAQGVRLWLCAPAALPHLWHIRSTPLALMGEASDARQGMHAPAECLAFSLGGERACTGRDRKALPAASEPAQRPRLQSPGLRLAQGGRVGVAQRSTDVQWVVAPFPRSPAVEKKRLS